MRFVDIVGQQKAKENILNMVANHRMPHATLILGKSGFGALPFALATAQYLLCQNPNNKDSCGECSSCVKMKILEHPDLLLSFPSIVPKPGAKAMSSHYLSDFRDFVRQTPYANDFDWLQFIKAENKQGNLSAEECRHIIDRLTLKAYEGGKKVMVMWMPEYLNESGNILLKQIEEPTENSYMIFVASDETRILPTILSRLQVLRLQPIPTPVIQDSLVERGKIDIKRAAHAALIAHGDYAEALAFITHQDEDVFPLIRNWFNQVFTNNAKGISEFVEEIGKQGREQQKNFLELVIRLLQQTMVLQLQPGKMLDADGDEAAFITKLAQMPSISFETLQEMMKLINHASYSIKRNANAKIQFHSLSIKLTYVLKRKPLPKTVE